MQISAINSVNFCSKKSKKSKDTTSKQEQMSNAEKHEANVKDANNDISPITCFVGILTGLAALKGGAKVVGATRRLAAGAGDKIATTAVNVAKKVKKSIDVDSCTKRIHDFFNRLSLDGTKENESIKKAVTSTVDQIFSGKDETGKFVGDKGEKFVEKLRNNKIYMSGTSLFDNAVAAAGAYIAMDGMSDATEHVIDRKKIQKSVIENFGSML